jgi:hypothetical protein
VNAVPVYRLTARVGQAGLLDAGGDYAEVLVQLKEAHALIHGSSAMKSSIRAADIALGEYWYRYEDGARPSDLERADFRAGLVIRGLALENDDTGLLVVCRFCAEPACSCGIQPIQFSFGPPDFSSTLWCGREHVVLMVAGDTYRRCTAEDLPLIARIFGEEAEAAAARTLKVTVQAVDGEEGLP